MFSMTDLREEMMQMNIFFQFSSVILVGVFHIQDFGSFHYSNPLPMHRLENGHGPETWDTIKNSSTYFQVNGK